MVASGFTNALELCLDTDLPFSQRVSLLTEKGWQMPQSSEARNAYWKQQWGREHYAGEIVTRDGSFAAVLAPIPFQATLSIEEYTSISPKFVFVSCSLTTINQRISKELFDDLDLTTIGSEETDTETKLIAEGQQRSLVAIETSDTTPSAQALLKITSLANIEKEALK